MRKRSGRISGIFLISSLQNAQEGFRKALGRFKIKNTLEIQPDILYNASVSPLIDFSYFIRLFTIGQYLMNSFNFTE